jgi:hypothetical protein
VALSAAQYKQLQLAILAAYPKLNELKIMLDYRLDKDLESMRPAGASYKYVVFEVIKQAEAQGWTDALVAAVREDRPGNREVAELAAALGLAAS